MKKSILILAFAIMSLMTFAQFDYTSSASIPTSGTFWDYTDTLTDADTVTMTMRIKSNVAVDMEYQIVWDELTGAGTATLTAFGSNDGVTYVTASPTISGALTADGSIWCKISDFNWSYCKLVLTLAGTQTSTQKCFYSLRYE